MAASVAAGTKQCLSSGRDPRVARIAAAPRIVGRSWAMGYRPRTMPIFDLDVALLTCPAGTTTGAQPSAGTSTPPHPRPGRSQSTEERYRIAHPTPSVRNPGLARRSAFPHLRRKVNAPRLVTSPGLGAHCYGRRRGRVARPAEPQPPSRRCLRPALSREHSPCRLRSAAHRIGSNHRLLI